MYKIRSNPSTLLLTHEIHAQFETLLPRKNMKLTQQGRNHQQSRNMVCMNIWTWLFLERTERHLMAIFRYTSGT